jgi:hypothetical protein
MNFYLVIENVAEELSWLSPDDRWTLFLMPLIDALTAKGLGTVLNVDELVQEVDGRRIIVGNEIAMKVSDLEQGWTLIRQIETEAQARLHEKRHKEHC